MSRVSRCMPVAVALATALAAPVWGSVIVPGRAVVRLDPGVDIAVAIAQIEAVFGGEAVFTVEDDTLSSRDIYLLAFDEAGAVAGDMNVILDLWVILNPDTAEWAELLVAAKDPESNTGSLWFYEVGGAQEYPDQYAQTAVGAPAAHALTRGVSTVIAVVDTGIDSSHIALNSAVLPHGWNFIDDTPDASDTGDGIDNDGDGLVDESFGHGTFVAGLIRLTAPDARLLPVKVLDDEGRGDAWLLAKGLFYSIDKGVEVINLSLGAAGYSQLLDDGVSEAHSHGIVVAAAAGNDGHNMPAYPAVLSKALGVAAVDDHDVKAAFSNYHGELFISAPGDTSAAGSSGSDPARTVYSTLPGGHYGSWEGTSFATALVSGAAAMIRSQDPRLPADSTTAIEIADRLASTAVDIDVLNQDYEGQIGVGRLAIDQAVALDGPAPIPGDLDRNGHVDEQDFYLVYQDYGLTHSSADLNGDGIVGVGDVLILLKSWEAQAAAPIL